MIYNNLYLSIMIYELPMRYIGVSGLASAARLNKMLNKMLNKS